MTVGNARITGENAADDRIIFRPKDAAECEALQAYLLDEGFAWSHGPKTICNVDNCIANGLIIMNGLIYYRTPEDRAVYTPFPVRQASRDWAPPVPEPFLHYFNRLSERLETLERKIDKIYGELQPSPGLDKPILKMPGAR